MVYDPINYTPFLFSIPEGTNKMVAFWVCALVSPLENLGYTPEFLVLVIYIPIMYLERTNDVSREEN